MIFLRKFIFLVPFSLLLNGSEEIRQEDSFDTSESSTIPKQRSKNSGWKKIDFKSWKQNQEFIIEIWGCDITEIKWYILGNYKELDRDEFHINKILKALLMDNIVPVGEL